MTSQQSDLFVKHLLGKEYGWTEREVDDTPARDVEAFLYLIASDKRRERQALNEKGD